MKHFTYIVFATLLVLSGCNIEPGQEIIAEIETCELYAEISYPGLWQFREVNFDGKDVMTDVQFLDWQIGYVSGNTFENPHAFAKKTTDGGLTWDPVEVNIEACASAFWFQTEALMFIGLENDESEALRIARSTNGGDTWEELVYPEYSGTVTDIFFKNDEMGFAVLESPDSLDPIKLLRTRNAGQSWEEIFEDRTLHHNDAKLRMTITENLILQMGDGGNIFVLNHNGDMLANRQVPETEIHQMVAVSDLEMFAVGSTGMYKTINGGVTWEMILTGASKIGAFYDGNAGVVVHNHNVCASDVYHAHDVLSVTRDNGETWVQGELTSNLLAYMVDSQRISETLAVCLFKNKLLFCDRG